jgi:hypothetical protein
LRHFSAARVSGVVLGVLTLVASANAWASPGETSVAASRAGRVVIVTWRAPHGRDLLGFDVYRADGTRRVRVTRKLISETRLFGGAYEFVDGGAPVKATRYWVQVVRLGGARSWLGSVAAEHAIP